MRVYLAIDADGEAFIFTGGAPEFMATTWVVGDDGQDFFQWTGPLPEGMGPGHCREVEIELKEVVEPAGRLPERAGRTRQ